MEDGPQLPRIVLITANDLNEIERQTRNISLRNRDEELINNLIQEFQVYGVDKTRLGMPIVSLSKRDMELFSIVNVSQSDLRGLNVWNVHGETLQRFQSLPLLHLKTAGVIGTMNFVDGRHRIESIRRYVKTGEKSNSELFATSKFLVKIVLDFSPSASRFLSLQNSRSVLANVPCVTDIMNCLPEPGTQFSGLKELLKDKELSSKLLLPGTDSVKKILAISFALFPSVKHVMEKHRSTGLFVPKAVLRGRKGFSSFLLGLEHFKLFPAKESEGQRLFRGCSLLLKERLQLGVVVTAIVAWKMQMPWKSETILNRVASYIIDLIPKDISFEALDENAEEKVVWKTLLKVGEGKLVKKSSSSGESDFFRNFRSVLKEALPNSTLFTMWDLRESEINSADFVQFTNVSNALEMETADKSSNATRLSEGGQHNSVLHNWQNAKKENDMPSEEIERNVEEANANLSLHAGLKESSSKVNDDVPFAKQRADVEGENERENEPKHAAVGNAGELDVERPILSEKKSQGDLATDALCSDSDDAAPSHAAEPSDTFVRDFEHGTVISPDSKPDEIGASGTKSELLAAQKIGCIAASAGEKDATISGNGANEDVSERPKQKPEEVQLKGRPSPEEETCEILSKTSDLQNMLQSIGLEDEKSPEHSNKGQGIIEEGGQNLYVEEDTDDVIEIETEARPLSNLGIHRTSMKKGQPARRKKRKRSKAGSGKVSKKYRLDGHGIDLGAILNDEDRIKKNCEKETKGKQGKLRCLESCWTHAMQLTEWFKVLGVHIGRDDRVLFSSPEKSNLPGVAFVDFGDFWEDGRSSKLALQECAKDGTQFSTVIYICSDFDSSACSELRLGSVLYEVSNIFILSKKDWNVIENRTVSLVSAAVVYKIADSFTREVKGRPSIPTCVIWSHQDQDRFLRDVYLTVVEAECNLFDFTCGKFFVMKALCHADEITYSLRNFYRAMPYSHGIEYKRCYKYLRDVCLRQCHCDGHCALEGIESKANEINNTDDVPDAMKTMFRCEVGREDGDVFGAVKVIRHSSLLLRRTKGGETPMAGYSDNELCANSHDKNGEMFELGAFLPFDECEKLMEKKSNARITLLYPRGELVDAETASKELGRFLSPFDLKTMYMAGITDTHLWYFMNNNSIGSSFNTIEDSESVCVHIEENYKNGSDFRVLLREGFERFLRSESSYIRFVLDVRRFKKYLKAKGDKFRCKVCGAVELFTAYGNEYYL